MASPCLHGGSCFNTMGSFRCTCPPQWTGERCETGQCFNCENPFSARIQLLEERSNKHLKTCLWYMYMYVHCCLFHGVKTLNCWNISNSVFSMFCVRCGWVYGQLPSLSPWGHLYQHPGGLHLSVPHWLDRKELWNRSGTFYEHIIYNWNFTNSN